ncbi:hypothetical protein MHPYR_10358 [uncultured Mycobacterium sp.]|uniref:Uncharacterized protein n=1 Tax=uncultured Mycobacterium sp. TaxID=171292 RepID=A0A1Y5P0J7_9MYCO|nr:hypothetical protein MHPYR_10358 [uncultured Mycobacterium sp.]
MLTIGFRSRPGGAMSRMGSGVQLMLWKGLPKCVLHETVTFSPAIPRAAKRVSECRARRFSGKVELWTQSFRFAAAVGS